MSPILNNPRELASAMRDDLREIISAIRELKDDAFEDDDDTTADNLAEYHLYAARLLEQTKAVMDRFDADEPGAAERALFELREIRKTQMEIVGTWADEVA